MEDNVEKVGGEEDDEGTGNCVELMELVCEPYVDEGGPSDDDTETKEAIAKQKSVTKKKKGLIMWKLKGWVLGRAPGLVMPWHNIDVF